MFLVLTVGAFWFQSSVFQNHSVVGEPGNGNVAVVPETTMTGTTKASRTAPKENKFLAGLAQVRSVGATRWSKVRTAATKLGSTTKRFIDKRTRKSMKDDL